MYSNTTLVKVKLQISKQLNVIDCHSNTTLVKVKSKIQTELSMYYLNSNTTLVKVKLENRQLKIRITVRFKYNTC